MERTRLGHARLDALPRPEEIAVNLPVLVFSASITALTGILFGLMPALDSSSLEFMEVVKSGSRGLSARRRTGRLRSAFVILEIALAVPLLVAAGLLGRSFARLTTIDPGFKPEHCVRFDVALPIPLSDAADSIRMVRFTDEVVRRLQAIPGTQIAAAGDGVPFGQNLGITAFDVQGQPPAPPDRSNLAQTYQVTPGYFAALGIPLHGGRVFSDDDRSRGRRVIIVNQALVNAVFQGANPIGKTLTTLSDVDSAGNQRAYVFGEIVGVVGDTKDHGLSLPASPGIYSVYDQSPSPRVTFIVRSTAQPGFVLRAAKSQVASVDPTLPIFKAMPYDEVIRDSVVRPRLTAWIVEAFAVPSLLLAAVGIYGIVAFAVGERRRELGIRLALGARNSQVVALVLVQGLRLAAIGLGIGFGIAIMGSRLLRSVLFGITSNDVPTYGLVFGTLSLVVAIALLVPALRAARVDPVSSMRLE